ncbi:MAG: prephenate dehydrogenase/arogenate dehydrogenase family protein [Bacteroidales bacterium OttesenSCG-928-I14]|jgi:prephenate dehydrogenase|nr:prephenate dehydrogenase/arogenate dehydrogenase family protein [Bacteroidales bacterium OttesenSCG-928-I14]
MKIQILGAGKMGTFFIKLLSFNHKVAVFDLNSKRLQFDMPNCIYMNNSEEIAYFKPEILINTANVQCTIKAFEQVLPYLPTACIVSDIASVKTGLKEFYKKIKHSFVSTHPMFGPTFTNLNNLSYENAIIISESNNKGKLFFRNLYKSLKLNVFEYSFEEHDKTMAYALSVPFIATLIFASIMKHQEAPGTTFKKHMNITHGLLSEDDYLLTEILFNPYTITQLKRIQSKLSTIYKIIDKKNNYAMKIFLERIRKKLRLK